MSPKSFLLQQLQFRITLHSFCPASLHNDATATMLNGGDAAFSSIMQSLADSDIKLSMTAKKLTSGAIKAQDLLLYHMPSGKC